MPPGGLFRGLAPPLDEATRKEALADPGPTWREFFLYELLKWWIGLGFLIADVLLVASFLHPLDLAVMLPLLVGVVYLELLLAAYLWARPKLDRSASTGGFRASWHRPFRYGRWTPEADRARAGLDPVPWVGPDPREFL